MSDLPTPLEFKSTLANLRQYVRMRKVVERCELCSIELPHEHQHLVEPESRRIACCCDPCAILFSNTSEAKFRRIPRQARTLSDFVLTDPMWNDLGIPIHLAFFFYCSPAERVVAMYPSPAGATESLLSFQSWSELVSVNPTLEEMEPDVEALLINRLGGHRGYTTPRHFIAPIDQCYALVGLVRGYWRGLSGGTEVWQHIREFFEQLENQALVTHKTLPTKGEVVDA